MADDSTLARLVARYERQPILRGLVQLVPFGAGSAIDLALLTHFSNLREERLREFFDELAAGEVALTEEAVRSDSFLHCYFATIKAAVNSRRREKIRALGRMLTRSVIQNGIREPDIYEECLSILEELSERELRILSILDARSTAHPHREDQNPLQHAAQFWDSFVADACAELGIVPDELGAMLTRLARTGLYAPIVGSYWDYKGEGRLTPLFHRLKELVGEFPRADV